MVRKLLLDAMDDSTPADGLNEEYGSPEADKTEDAESEVSEAEVLPKSSLLILR